MQFYQGSDDTIPFGQELRGPKYISIDYWEPVACDGFENNTFFVSGSAGALSDYSIRIGGLDSNAILDLNMMKDENKKEHHTHRITDYFALRRATTFNVTVKVPIEYGPNCHEIKFKAYHTFDGEETEIDIPEFETKVPVSEWGAQRVNIVNNLDTTKTVELTINVPASVSIGEYENFKVLIQEKNTGTIFAEKNFPEKIIFLLNPWGPEDDVFLAGDDLRTEYIMEEKGIMYQTLTLSGFTEKQWTYNQFNTYTVETLLHLLEKQNSATRSDAKLIARIFSKLVNSDDNDNGILTGKWPLPGEENPFLGGTRPWLWTSSSSILTRYVRSGFKPVKFGQCWVFAGVLTSIMRLAGIPSRPLTNYDSGWDTNGDNNIDIFRNDSQRSETYWYYHVWNDVWITNEWHAVDATPQEKSDGFFQLGPAPHSSIKGQTGGSYDVNFVVAEVDADIRLYVEDANEDILLDTLTEYIGHDISTKHVGNDTRSDITALYKTPEGLLFRARTDNPVSASIEFVIPASVSAGDAIRLAIRLSDPKVDIRVKSKIEFRAISYNGVVLNETISEFGNEENIKAGDASDTLLVILPSDYTPFLASTNTFETFMYTLIYWDDDLGTEEKVYATGDFKITNIDLPDPSIEANPSTSLAIGDTGAITCTYINTLSIDLTNVQMVFSSSEGLTFNSSIGNNETSVGIDIGDIPAGSTISESQSFQVLEEGFQSASCNVFGDQLFDSFADAIIQVFQDCNGNGKSDLDDIKVFQTSQDCNNNDIPDECEADCNGNGIQDDCEIAQDLTLDCNANNVIDICDIDSGVSKDDNFNNVPDECDPDCNNNGIPDDIDIKNGSFDFNSNGVPDECDFDCNGNGISDEVDISSGVSLDLDQNGIPDECQVTKAPTEYPSTGPSELPSIEPSFVHSESPSTGPSETLSIEPSSSPSNIPSVLASFYPSIFSSENPTIANSFSPSENPTITVTPSFSSFPSYKPTQTELSPFPTELSPLPTELSPFPSELSSSPTPAPAQSNGLIQLITELLLVLQGIFGIICA